MDRIAEHELPKAGSVRVNGPAPRISQAILGYFWAVGGVFSATAFFWLMRGRLDSGQASLLYLPIVIACAARYGFRSAVLAALLSFLCWDYFFLPPLHALNVTNPHDLISLVVFLIAAVTTGRLAAHARSQARNAQARLHETEVLYQASHLISREVEPGSMLNALVDHVVETCMASRCVILRFDPQSPEMTVANSAGESPLTLEQERMVRRTAVSAVAQRTVIRQSDPPGGITVPLLVKGDPFGAMHVGVRTDGLPFSPQDERLILTLANHAAIVLARQFQEEQAKQQARQAAVLEERNRLANDIHDTLSHAFTGIKFLLEAALRVGPTPQATECLTQARHLAIEGAQEARRSVWALRPSSLAGEGGLPSAIRSLILRQTGATEIVADVAVHGDVRPLPGMTEEHLLRICQEALTNILRHSGASRVEIVLTYAERHVGLAIRDNGAGFLVPDAGVRSGFGLISMQERAARIGGWLEVASGVGQGTEIAVHAPLTPMTPHHGLETQS